MCVCGTVRLQVVLDVTDAHAPLLTPPQAVTLVQFASQLVVGYTALRAGWKQGGAAAALAAEAVKEIVTLLKLLALLTARELQVRG
jgi:hypothetical protein